MDYRQTQPLERTRSRVLILFLHNCEQQEVYGNIHRRLFDNFILSEVFIEFNPNSIVVPEF
jgi:hypothetical protein